MSVSRSATPARKALLLIDFQRDFLTETGRMPVARHQIDPLIAATNDAIRIARADGIPIIAIGNEFRRSDRVMNLLRRNAAVAGSAGAQWDARVPIDGVAYFAKQRGDAFSNPALGIHLKEQGVGEVVLSGLMARACVTATAKGALARGLKVGVLRDAVADLSDRARDAALARLSRRGADVRTRP
jgi:nicotinamidase-related amidase